MPAKPFRIEVGAVSGLADGALVSFNGPIDAKNIQVFRAQMDALRGRRFRNFVLDMGEVRYINSTGLAYLVTMAEEVQGADGSLVLFGVQPKVKVILETMGMVGFLRVYPSRAAAVKDLRKAKPAQAPAPLASSVPAPRPGAIRRLFRRLFGLPADRRL